MSGSRGYTFPIMLIIVTVLAFGAVRLEMSSRYKVRRDREQELLFRGRAYMSAIKNYYLADPVAQRRHYPKSLDDLLSDSRFDGRAFIRQLYKDPMTGEDFKPVLAGDQSIIGVVSQGKDAPFQKTDFPKDLYDFDKANTYEDWKFLAVRPAVTRTNSPGVGAGTAEPANAQSSYH